MKHLLLVTCVFLFAMHGLHAQDSLYVDTVNNGKVLVHKDPRLDELVKKEAVFNEALAMAARSGKGYRLLVLRTNDRSLAMKVRTQLLQLFPEQKVYMSFQPPYIKLKFGNFLERSDADIYKKQIAKNNLVTGNIYVIPELIEVKGDKAKEQETN